MTRVPLILVTAGAAAPAPPPDLLDRANKGDVRARPSLAYASRDGNGVARDYAEAMR